MDAEQRRESEKRRKASREKEFRRDGDDAIQGLSFLLSLRAGVEERDAVRERVGKRIVGETGRLASGNLRNGSFLPSPHFTPNFERFVRIYSCHYVFE
jgi:hypothetical protein